jgi:anionic cell wall polymer biosynthesis LytR-Cps2A-Psr (LCP) family protein
MPLGNITKKVNITENGNINVLLNEVTSLTGLTIDYHAVIDMEKFVEAVDNIGGKDADWERCKKQLPYL